MKDCKKREVTTLHEAVAMIESIENLQSNAPALIQALGVHVYEKLRVLPIDKNAKDTIAAILPRDASAGELMKVNLVVKLIAVTLSTLRTEISPDFFLGDNGLELDHGPIYKKLFGELSQASVAIGNEMGS